MSDKEKEEEVKLFCPKCGEPVKILPSANDPQECDYYCKKCDKPYHSANVAPLNQEDREAEDLKEAVDLWLGRLILVKWAGFGVFGLSLALFVLSSLIQLFWLTPLLTNALLFGIALIIVGVLGEKVLTQ